MTTIVCGCSPYAAPECLCTIEVGGRVGMFNLYKYIICIKLVFLGGHASKHSSIC